MTGKTGTVKPQYETDVVLGAIRKHLDEYGAKDWKLVMQAFPGLDDRRFWRLVAKVKGGSSDDEILASAVKYARWASGQEFVPAPPSPAIIASGGADVRKALDFLASINRLVDRAEGLYEFSMSKPDDNGNRTIKNPLYYTQAIKLHKELLEMTLRAYQEVWDLQKMMDFYDTIIGVIGTVDPATQARVLDALQKVNNERGLTMDARITLGSSSRNALTGA